MRGLAIGSAAALVIGSTLALADSATDAVRLDYQVDSRCAGADAFVAEVHARSPRVRFAPDASRALVVRVEPRGGKLAGRIELGSTQRAVTGATCDEVLSALGLMTALALDPLGMTTAATTDASAEATADANASDAGASADAGPAREIEEKPAWSFGAGADVEAVFGVAPDPVLAVPVFFEATRALSEHVALGGALRFAHAGETALTSGTGADFDWTAGSADLCVVLRSGRLRFNACERTTIGAIEAQGLGVVPSRNATRPWVDLGLALSLRARVVGPVFVEAAGQIGLALVQDRFFLEPNQTVFQVPGFTAQAGGGIGFEIW